MSDDVSPIYLELKSKILAKMKEIAKQAKKKADLCAELLSLKRLVSAVGGKQLPPERREELRNLIKEAMKQGGCL